MSKIHVIICAPGQAKYLEREMGRRRAGATMFGIEETETMAVDHVRQVEGLRGIVSYSLTASAERILSERCAGNRELQDIAYCIRHTMLLEGYRPDTRTYDEAPQVFAKVEALDGKAVRDGGEKVVKEASIRAIKEVVLKAFGAELKVEEEDDVRSDQLKVRVRAMTKPSVREWRNVGYLTFPQRFMMAGYTG